MDQLREFREYEDYGRLPPAIRLLVEFAEERGLFDEEKGTGKPGRPPAERKERPREMPAEEPHKLPEGDSLKIIKLRLARGEITKEEYAELKKVLEA